MQVSFQSQRVSIVCGDVGILDDIPLRIGLPHIAIDVAKGGLGMIQTGKVQDGCMPVVNMDGLFDRLVAKLVGR